VSYYSKSANFPQRTLDSNPVLIVIPNMLSHTKLNRCFQVIGLLIVATASALTAEVDDIQLLQVKAIRSIQIYQNNSDLKSSMGIRFSNGSEKSLRFRDSEFKLSASRVLTPEEFLGKSILYTKWAKDNSASVLVMIGDEKIGRPISASILLPALEQLKTDGKLGNINDSLTNVLKLIKLDYQETDKIRFQVIIPFGTASVELLEIGPGTPVQPSTFDTNLDLLVGHNEDSETSERLIQIMNIFGDPSNIYTLTLVGDGEVGVKLANGWVSQKVKVEYGFNPTIQREVLLE